MHQMGEQVKATQAEPILGKNMVKNSGGGFAFKLDKWAQLQRFLILGSERGTYYQQEKALTKENATVVLECIKEDGLRVVRIACRISEEGRAPKNDPALFVMALASVFGNDHTRGLAFHMLPVVARMSTHLFHFVQYRKAFTGWSRGMRNAIKRWYESKSCDAVAYQVSKYVQRDGWSHRDLLRLAHIKTADPMRNSIYGWAVKGGGTSHPYLNAVHQVSFLDHTVPDHHKQLCSLVTDFQLPREVIPTDFLRYKETWNSLLPHMPLTAMIRNLGTMSTHGLLKPFSGAAKLVVSRLTDMDQLKKARVHPISLLSALNVYAQGKGEKGKNTWTPVDSVVEALNEAFYLSFGLIEPTGKRTVLGIDVSASMGWECIAGVPGVTPAMGAAAMAMVAVRTEPQTQVIGFSRGPVLIPLTKHMRLDQVMGQIEKLTHGSTDCAVPMTWAQNMGLQAEAFYVYTDNETNSGRVHPCQALTEYRRKTGIPAKLVVIGMTSTGFSIADPNDAGMMDVVGFDTAVPNLLADFMKN